MGKRNEPGEVGVGELLLAVLPPEGGVARPQSAGAATPEGRAAGPEAGAARAQAARPGPANAATPEGSAVRAEAADGPSGSDGGEFVSSMGGASRRIGRAAAVRQNVGR